MTPETALSPGRGATPAVEVREVEKTFVLGTNAVPALRGVTLSIMPGEFVAVMGPSGCGKTTLLNMVGLLDDPTRGSVLIDGRDVSSLSDNEKADLRRDKLGFVFQFYNLLPMLTAFENVEIPLNFKGLNKEERSARVQELLVRVGLSGRSHHLPAELSGGEQQRVTIARALANRPTIVLLDEPTGDLDSKTGEEIMELVFRLNREEGTTFIMVTHDADLAARAGRILSMKDGKIVEEAAAAPPEPGPAEAPPEPAPPQAVEAAPAGLPAGAASLSPEQPEPVPESGREAKPASRKSARKPVSGRKTQAGGSGRSKAAKKTGGGR